MQGEKATCLHRQVMCLFLELLPLNFLKRRVVYTVTQEKHITKEETAQ
jgi:hypothetical protein